MPLYHVIYCWSFMDFLVSMIRLYAIPRSQVESSKEVWGHYKSKEPLIQKVRTGAASPLKLGANLHCKSQIKMSATGDFIPRSGMEQDGTFLAEVSGKEMSHNIFSNTILCFDGKSQLSLCQWIVSLATLDPFSGSTRASFQ